VNRRQPPLGAVPEADRVTRFCVWAPDRRTVELELDAPEGLRRVPLERAQGGYFVGRTEAPPGTQYRYRLDGAHAYNDPCSRFQPEGPHGPSMVVDSASYRWRDEDFRPVPLRRSVLYELHVGTFTPEGTYAGALARLPHLRDVGVNVLELMPLNTFPGRFNWGYDGTHLFAPCATYGTPEGLRRFVDAAHAHGIAVILDVVYNHLGPNGNYLWQYARDYFSSRFQGEWGEPLNFDAEGTRSFVIENARHWIAEYHLDGLRIDATQGLFDDSERHILAELTEAVRSSAPHKQLLLVAENEPQDRRMVTPVDRRGLGCDTMWIDDFHHSARVALTFRAEAYTQDYRGTAQELLSCARHNSLYQGQWYAWQNQPRGTPMADLPPERAVFFLQDHDQIANFLRGSRIHRFGEARVRAMTVMWLLLPQLPMLFMGQEFFASAPFCYFVDHPPELSEKVKQGRVDFVSQFPSAAYAFKHEGYDERIDESAFRRSRIDWSEAEKNAPILALHKELLRLRREDPVFSGEGSSGIDGATLSDQALVLRWFGGRAGDRLLILNLGPELSYEPCPQPLLAPVPGRKWFPMMSSKEIRFGGHGATFPDGVGPWRIPGQCGLVLTSDGPHSSDPPQPASAREREA
jgi:maltooligosyltrehalose trehalohydrolase